MLCGRRCNTTVVFAATHRALPEFTPEGQVGFVQVVQVEGGGSGSDVAMQVEEE